MNQQYRIMKSYQDHDLLRKSFNNLAKEIFELDFEDWYQNGYWGEDYIPYSIIKDDQVIANVSVNQMNFDCMGETINYIQLGTVMTKKEFRNQGLSKRLIDEIMNDYKEHVDGFYLFANDSVLDFYPKFGFRKGIEFQCSKEIHNKKDMSAKLIPMEGKKEWSTLVDIASKSVNYSLFEMKQNIGLIMFYVTKFMRENVYFIEELNTYVIAEIEEEKLIIFHVFSLETYRINQIIEAFGSKVKKVTMGFTPIEFDEFVLEEIQEENSTLFLMGKDFDIFEQQKIMFPLLSHA